MSMVGTSFAVRPLERAHSSRALALGMVCLLAFHGLLLLTPLNAPAGSRILTAAMPLLAGLCCVWRARKLNPSDRPTWLWASAGLFLYATAHLVETFVSHSAAASNLSVDPSDYIYMTATFPLLMALSTTRETASLRSVFALNCAQIGLALVLSYVLLYRMSLTSAAASTQMGRIYGVACAILAIMAALRMLTWMTAEEKQSILWMSVVLWSYLPVELGMDYATAHWGLQAGTPADLLWSIPFFLGGWKALHAPIAPPRPSIRRASRRLLAEALCPMLITAGIFVLAAAVIRQHPALGLAAILILLAIQACQAALVQMNYLSGRNHLLEREHDLQLANDALQRLSMEDPLTRIPNRRHFETALETAWRRALRRHQPLALLMIDVDYFKGVNDRHGHSYGDDCLVSLAGALLQQARRPDDVVARIGGEEFVLLLPETDRHGSEMIARHVHDAIRLLDIANLASPFENRLTVSIGICVANPTSPAGSQDFLEHADRALYQAKNAGRNTSCFRPLH